MRKLLSLLILAAVLLSTFAVFALGESSVEYIFDSESACERLAVSPEETYYLGDIDNDDFVTVNDTKTLKKILISKEDATLYPHSDITGDGEITVKDLKMLAKILSGTELSVEITESADCSVEYSNGMQSAKLTSLKDTSNGADAYLATETLDISVYAYAVITYMTPKSANEENSSVPAEFALGTDDTFNSFPLVNDGRFHSQTVSVSDLSAWDGNLTLRFFDAAEAGDTVYIDSVIFCNGAESALECAAQREKAKKSFTITDSTSTVISDYTVVLSENADVYEKYAAEILCTRIEEISGVKLETSIGGTDVAEYEIVIGSAAQNRNISLPDLAQNQYTVFKSENTVVLDGCDYMVGGAVAFFCENVGENGSVSDSIPNTASALDYAPIAADSVILMIGDGMGFNHVAFADGYSAKQTEWPYDYTGFTAKSFPSQGDCTTLSASDMTGSGQFKTDITDSAAAATALATGWKTQNKKLGYNLFGSKVKNIRELAAEQGLKTAVISTEDTTGATPAAFTVHNVSRSNIDEIRADQAMLVENGEITFLRGNLPGEHQLLEETKTALNTIASGGGGFFAMIEEAHIDKSCDRTYETGYKREDTAKFVCRFDEAIKYAATFTAAYPGTVLIVTADHETGALNSEGFVKNSGQHTGLAVPVYAMGYGTEQFNDATTDNVKIARFMAAVFGASTFGADVPFIS